MAVPILICLLNGADVVNLTSKTTTYDAIGTEGDDMQSLPISLADLGARIGTAADRLGSRAEAAKAIGVSPSALQRYIKGDNEPPFRAVARLAMMSGCSMVWLATGNGSETAPVGHSQPLRLDPVILGRAVYVLNGLLAHADSHLDPEDYAEMLLALVEYLREHSGALAPDNVISIMERIRSRRNERR